MVGLAGSIWQRLLSFLSAPAAPTAAVTHPTDQPKSAFAPGVDPTLGVEELDKIIENIRSYLIRTGAGLGGIVATVFGAIGYTQVHDFFPFPADAPGWLGWAVAASAGLGAGAATFLVVRFYYAQRRILIGSDLSGLPRGLSVFGKKTGRDRALAKRVTEEFAREERAATILALDLRTSRLDRIARQLDPSSKRAQAVHAEAERLAAVVRLALVRTAASLLERRARGAFGGVVSWIAIVLAVGGIGFTFAVADYAKGKRSLPEQQILESDACIARVNASTRLSPADKQTLTEACVNEAKAGLGETTTTATTTTSTTTSTAATTTATTTGG